MRNLTGDRYPVMAVRGKRTIVADMSGNEGEITGVFQADRLGVLHTQGSKLYRNRAVLVDMGLNDRPKQFVTMGQHLIILPDMKYIDMEDTTNYGSMGHVVDVSEGTVTFELCNVQGQVYGAATASDTAPQNPNDKALWIDTSLDEKVLKQYSKNLGEWATIERTYVKISGLNYGTDGGTFRQYDGVTICGIGTQGAEHLNGKAILQNQDNYHSIVIEGLIDHKLEQDCAERSICIQRKVPIMDFVVEAGNRLWGCRYGKDVDGYDRYNPGSYVNKI
jgi:hypothetical protein